MILAKPAAIFRKQMFTVDEIFDSDLSHKRQWVSVPNVLWELVIGGTIRQSAVSPITARIATNIS